MSEFRSGLSPILIEKFERRIASRYAQLGPN